jgi:hypothetical protein
VALVAVLVGGGLLLRGPSPDGDSLPVSKAKTAAIVDQLSLSVPNLSFVISATATLQKAGYAVDYYRGEQVTVDFYREIPAHNYDLLILRVHSARIQEVRQSRSLDEVVLFTSEPYSPATHLEEQRARRIAQIRYYEGAEPYFGIGAEFIRSSMRGEFKDTTVIMMGCSGLTSTTTAEAFVQRGASAFVSWSDFVSADHTDAATERLLELMLIDGLPTERAVSQAAAEVGPDPLTEAELRVLTRDG